MSFAGLHYDSRRWVFLCPGRIMLGPRVFGTNLSKRGPHGRKLLGALASKLVGRVGILLIRVELELPALASDLDLVESRSAPHLQHAVRNVGRD